MRVIERAKRERERFSLKEGSVMGLLVWVCCVCARASMCECVCERVCMCVCVCVQERERDRERESARIGMTKQQLESLPCWGE